MNASQLDDIAAASRASPRAQSPEKRTADTIKSPEHKPDINSQAELKASARNHVATAKSKIPALVNLGKRIAPGANSAAATTIEPKAASPKSTSLQNSKPAASIDTASANVSKAQAGMLSDVLGKMSPRSNTASPRDDKIAMAKNLISELRNNLTTLQSKIDLLQAEQNKLEEIGHSAEGVEEKKVLRNSMLKDIERMAEAIKLANNDMVSIREENTKYKDLFNNAKGKVDSFENELSEATKFVDEVLEYRKFIDYEPEQISDPLSFCKKYDEHSLLLIISQMGNRLKEIEDERLEAKRYLADAKASKQQYERLKISNRELHDAHLLQNKFVRKLEKKNKEYLACKEQIYNQEQIIQKMQSIISDRIKPDKQPHFIEFQEGRANPMVAAEIYKLNDALTKDREIVADKETKLSIERKALEELQSQAFDLEGSLGDVESIDKLQEETEEKLKVNDIEMSEISKKKTELENEIKTRDIKINILDGQLQAAAKNDAIEISKLKVRLFENEMTFTTVQNAEDVGDANLILGYDDMKNLQTLDDLNIEDGGDNTEGIEAKLGLDFGHPGDPLLEPFVIPAHIQEKFRAHKQNHHQSNHHVHHGHHHGHHHGQSETPKLSARRKLESVLQAAAISSALSTARTSVDSTPRENEEVTSSNAKKTTPVVPKLDISYDVQKEIDEAMNDFETQILSESKQRKKIAKSSRRSILSPEGTPRSAVSSGRRSSARPTRETLSSLSPEGTPRSAVSSGRRSSARSTRETLKRDIRGKSPRASSVSAIAKPSYSPRSSSVNNPSGIKPSNIEEGGKSAREKSPLSSSRKMDVKSKSPRGEKSPRRLSKAAASESSPREGSDGVESSASMNALKSSKLTLRSPRRSFSDDKSSVSKSRPSSSKSEGRKSVSSPKKEESTKSPRAKSPKKEDSGDANSTERSAKSPKGKTPKAKDGSVDDERDDRDAKAEEKSKKSPRAKSPKKEDSGDANSTEGSAKSPKGKTPKAKDGSGGGGKKTKSPSSGATPVPAANAPATIYASESSDKPQTTFAV